MSPCAFVSSHRVTYAECTIGNHVYYARYLDILEEARGEFFRHLGKPLLALQAMGAAFPVLECRLKYHSPARYDDVLQIHLWPTFVKGVRLNFAYQVLGPDGKLVLEGETFHCCTNLSEKPRRLPEDLILLLQHHLRPPGFVIRGCSSMRSQKRRTNKLVLDRREQVLSEESSRRSG